MKAKVHFYNLDILRLVCALGVALHHVFVTYITWLGKPHFFDDHDVFFRITDQLISNFSIGVTAFFIISGFLITYLLLLEKTQHGNIKIGYFLIRRTLRIWPLYFLAIVLGYLMVTYMGLSDKPDYLSTVFFINNFSLIQTGNWTFPFSHFWSICIEEHFYLIWPFLIWVTPLKRIPWLIGLGLLASLLSRFYFGSIISDPIKLQLICQAHTMVRIDEMLAGALVAWLHFNKPISFSVSHYWRVSFYLLAIVILCVTPYIIQNQNIWQTLFKKYIYIGILLFWIGNYLFNEKAWFAFKSKNVLHYLGRISFGIYIFHNMIILPYMKYVVEPFQVFNIFIFILLYGILLIAISVLSYELFEKFFLKIKDRFAIIHTIA